MQHSVVEGSAQQCTTISKVCYTCRNRLSAKIPSHYVPSWLVYCSFLFSGNLLSKTFLIKQLNKPHRRVDTQISQGWKTHNFVHFHCIAPPHEVCIILHFHHLSGGLACVERWESLKCAILLPSTPLKQCTWKKTRFPKLRIWIQPVFWFNRLILI